jgi:2-dehydropantoate 2-reductase
MNPRDGGFADLVLFCVKAYDTETAAERLRPTIGPGTVILPVQNGIDSAERIGRVVESGHVIGGTAGVSSVLEAPGIIDHRSGPDEIRLGELDGQPSARVERIAEVLRRADAFATTGAALAVTFREHGFEAQVWFCGSTATGQAVARERRIEARRVWDLARLQREARQAGLDVEASTVEHLLVALGGEVRGWRPRAA